MISRGDKTPRHVALKTEIVMAYTCRLCEGAKRVRCEDMRMIVLHVWSPCHAKWSQSCLD